MCEIGAAGNFIRSLFLKGMLMNKKIPLGIAISLVAIGCAITFILSSFFSLNIFNSMVNINEREELNKKIEEIDKYVRADYVGTVDEEKLQDSVAAGYISGIGDNYGDYYSAKEYQALQVTDSGSTVGIGVSVQKEESGYIEIVGVREGSPAMEAGLLTGDFIVAVNEEDVLSKGYVESVEAVSGDEGTTVKLTVRREGVDQIYQLVRRKMDIISVVSRMIGDNVGYLKITHFDQKTPEQFAAQLEKLKTDGAEYFVFDVRNNGGGLLDSVEGVLNDLLPAGELATATYKDGRKDVIVKSDGQNVLSQPAVVLINNHTASSAELFACAMRDFNQSKLVGVNSFGKGVMQVTKELLDGSAIKITVATYETTRTPCYDGVGLKPNFEVTMTKDEEDNFAQLDETTDPQLKKAIEVVRAS